jgi:hypothetical protein
MLFVNVGLPGITIYLNVRPRAGDVLHERTLFVGSFTVRATDVGEFVGVL